MIGNIDKLCLGSDKYNLIYAVYDFKLDIGLTDVGLRI